MGWEAYLSSQETCWISYWGDCCPAALQSLREWGLTVCVGCVSWLCVLTMCADCVCWLCVLTVWADCVCWLSDCMAWLQQRQLQGAKQKHHSLSLVQALNPTGSLICFSPFVLSLSPPPSPLSPLSLSLSLCLQTIPVHQSSAECSTQQWLWIWLVSKCIKATQRWRCLCLCFRSYKAEKKKEISKSEFQNQTFLRCVWWHALGSQHSRGRGSKSQCMPDKTKPHS